MSAYARDITVSVTNKFTLWEALFIKELIVAILEGRKVTVEPRK